MRRGQYRNAVASGGRSAITHLCPDHQLQPWCFHFNLQDSTLCNSPQGLTGVVLNIHETPPASSRWSFNFNLPTAQPLSFSPAFSLGMLVHAHTENRFNGLPKPGFEEIRKPLKRFRNFERTLNPRLKPGENERLSFGTASAQCVTQGSQESSHWKYRLISVAIHLPTGTDTPFPIIR